MTALKEGSSGYVFNLVLQLVGEHITFERTLIPIVLAGHSTCPRDTLPSDTMSEGTMTPATVHSRAT